MISKNRSGIFAKAGIFLSLLVVLVFAADAAAQCYCSTTHHAHKKAVSSHKTVHYNTVHHNTNTYTPAYDVRGYNAYNTEVSQTTSHHIVVSNGYRRGYNPELVDEEGEIRFDPNYMDTARIGRDYGFHDGLKKGYFAALERKAYYPEKHGKYKNAARGYKSRFGSKQVYREAYREGFIRGYRSGYRSVASRETLRTVRNY